MSPGWIVELTMPAGRGSPNIVRYSVRCSDKDEAKVLVHDNVGVPSDTKTFFIRPLTGEEIDQHKLEEGEVRAWEDECDP